MYQPADQGFATYFLAMLADEDRNVKYAEAIKQCIAQFQKQQGRAPLVLDLGCGTGLLTRLALMHGAAKVVGVDTNHTMCSLATRALKAANIPAEKYEIYHGTVDEYAADKDIKFDVMVSEILGTLHTSENLPEYAKQASKYLNTFKLHGYDTCTYVVPSVCSTYLRTVVVRDDTSLPPAVQAYGRELLKQCTAAPSWTPTNELGAYFLERCDVEGRVEVRTDFFGKVPFQKKEALRSADSLEWPASEGVDLVVLEFECILWGTIRLHNTIDTVREIHETIGAAEALGRYDAWGFLCASVDSRSETAKLTSYSANGLPAIRLGSTTISAEINEVSSRHAAELRALADYTVPENKGEKWLCDRDAPRALYLQSIGADVILYEPDAVCRRLAERQSPDLRTASTSRGVLSLSEDRNAATVQDAYRADEVMTGASQSAAVRAFDGMEVKWPVVERQLSRKLVPLYHWCAKWSPGAPEPILVGLEGIIPQCDPSKSVQKTLRCDDNGAHWCLDLLGNAPLNTPARSFVCAQVKRTDGGRREDLAAKHARCQIFGPRILDVMAVDGQEHWTDKTWSCESDPSKGTVVFRASCDVPIAEERRSWLYSWAPAPAAAAPAKPAAKKPAKRARKK
jgi:SAM-dependent methyltransferase